MLLESKKIAQNQLHESLVEKRKEPSFQMELMFSRRLWKFSKHVPLLVSEVTAYKSFK